MRKILALLNPVAGSMNYEFVCDRLNYLAEQKALDLRIIETEASRNIAQVMSKVDINDYDRVLVGGGDGTIADAANALGTKVQFAILPCGTANILARELNVPLDAKEAIDLALTEDNERKVDAIEVDGELLLVHIAIGNYSYLAEDTSSDLKQKYGRFAYVIKAIPSMIRADRWKFSIRIGAKEFKHRAAFVMVTNVDAVGEGNWRWNDKSEIDDGKVEVCVVNATSLVDYFIYMFYVLIGKPKKFGGLTIYSVTNTAAITVAKKVPISGDGEIIGHSDLHIKVIPQALRIIAPPS